MNASFLSKISLKANNGLTSPSSGSSTAKKDLGGPQQTALERLLTDAGPVQDDGSDKFFGMENFGNTCYCNSILQCLYYSVPFRDQVINYPSRSPLDILNSNTPDLPRLNTVTASTARLNVSPTKSKTPGASPLASPGRRPVPASGSPAQTASRTDEGKQDTPEYRKKRALETGPILAMDYDNARNYGMPESLFTSLKDIFEAIIAHQSRTGVVSPQKFLETLKKENEMFRTSMHQDAHEFLNLLLNEVVANVESNTKRIKAENEQRSRQDNRNLDDALTSVLAATSAPSSGAKSPAVTGWVHDLFEGTLTSETKCLTCENISQRDEAFLDLSVDLDQHSSVTSCLRKFSEEEMLCERNKFHCDNCGGLQEAEKRMKIKRLPKILALHLKRFKYTEDLQRLQKLFYRVVYPYHLRLFNTTDDAEDPDRLYELYAVVVHIGGGPYHGHYVSIVKTQGRGWLLFDDEMVEPVDKSYVRNFFGDKPGLACAYVLFYQETTTEAVRREQEAENAVAVKAYQSTKEGALAGTRSNGLLANGILQHVQSAASPTIEDDDHFVNLDHAVTAPTSPPSTLLQRPGAAESITALPSLPGLSRKKSDVMSKKERAKEEKDRKAAEREKEKADKQLRKDLELRRKENDKKQLDDSKAASIAFRAPRNDEDTKLGEGGKENNSSGLMSASLSRFRQTSRSISRKPKFWSSKDKDDAKEVGEPARTQDAVVDTEDAESPAALNTPDKNEKPKTLRFSLKKKTSTVLS
ncbi:MAG: hypothetical protein M1835_005902 [Candelina submexicana]|nr:MAG: hypothetical protein M1835_005902 [Candelina submexicana]